MTLVVFNMSWYLYILPILPIPPKHDNQNVCHLFALTCSGEVSEFTMIACKAMIAYVADGLLGSFRKTTKVHM